MSTHLDGGPGRRAIRAAPPQSASRPAPGARAPAPALCLTCAPRQLTGHRELPSWKARPAELLLSCMAVFPLTDRL
jgi:hypothetical protein